MRQSVHASWFIGWISLGIICGVGLCTVVPPSIFISSVWFFGALSLIIICLIRRTKIFIVLVFIGGILIGVWRGSLLKHELQAYQPYYGRTLTVTGSVSQDTAYGKTGDQRLNLSNIQIDAQDLAGDVWVSTFKADVKRGDHVTVHGLFNPGFGNLSASMYRAELLSIERPNPGDIARRVRDWFGAGVRKAIPEPEVSLGLGYLVGQRTALPPDLEEQIKITGLTHVVVASGYNLTILVVFSRRIFMRLSKYAATLLSSLMIFSFMMVTGLSPSMTRAGFVATLGLLVWYYGRKMHPFVLLSFAAGVTVLFNPSYVWGDLGWYLSFGSFVGVIVVAPLLHHYFWGIRGDPFILRQLLVETLSATIVTTPVILLAFGQFSVFAIPANMLVLPFVPLAMLCTFIAGIAGLVVPAFAQLAGLPATYILKYSIAVIEKVAELPNAQKSFEFNPGLMLGSYLVMGALITFLIRRTNHDFRSENDKEIL